MILKILLVVLGLIAVILIYAATKPGTFHIQRSVTIKAAPESVFPLIDDLHNWPRWAPQDREDPTMKRSFAGSERGAGAISNWSGSGNTGQGRMTITGSIPSKSVTLAVDWERPFKARNMNEFLLEPDGSNTRVTWSMTGPNLYVMKLMSVFTNMDRMMGQHFESGRQAQNHRRAVIERTPSTCPSIPKLLGDTQDSGLRTMDSGLLQPKRVSSKMRRTVARLQSHRTHRRAVPGCLH